MNLKPLLQVADQIEQHPETFDMANWCGTACCVAGHVNKLYPPKDHEIYAGSADAQETLGINKDQADKLFVPRFFNMMELNNNPKETAAMLRWMVQNDKPNWEKAMYSLGYEKMFLRGVV